MRSFLGMIVLGALCLSGCATPMYAWGYEHTASPKATAAYIRAVMASEAGMDEQALAYYDLALSYEKSPKVSEEREAVVRRLKNKN